MRESAFEAKLRGIIRSKGGLCLKWVSPGFTGVPDRIVFLPKGKIIFVEVKRPDGKGKLAARQKRVAQLLTKLGQKVITVDSVEEFIDEIQAL